ncbi:OmpP1/FadL family transporter [candidate division KSB1 bacterium]
MKKIILSAALGIFVCLNSMSSVSAQEPEAYSEVAFLAQETGIGARALGLGGAYMAVADDYTALYWNPAALGLARTSELFLSLTHSKRTIDTNFLSINGGLSQAKTAFGSAGFAYAVDTFQGSLVFAAGYNRVHNYNSLFNYAGFNPGMTYMGYSFEIPDVPTDLYQEETVETAGNLSQFAFGASIEVSEGVFIGGAFNFWNGQNNYNQTYSEVDDEDLYQNDFDFYANETVIDTDINGFDMKLGLLYKYSEKLNLAATINTPRFLTLDENYSFNEDLVFDDGAIDYLDEYDDLGTFEYKMRLPFVFGTGVSYTLPNALISAEIRYVDWTQMEFRSEPSFNLTRNEANRNIKQTLESTVSPRVGVEFMLPDNRAKLRFGYAQVPSPIKDADSGLDQKFFSGGFGMELGPDASLDLVYRRGWWNTTVTSYYSDVPVSEEHVDHRVFASLSFRY